MGLLRLAIALVLVTVVGVFSACGAEDLSPETIANAAKATSERGGARIAMTIDMTMPDGQDIEMAGDGVTDMTGKKGRLSFDLSQVPGGEGQFDQVFDGFVFWMRMPAFEGELPDGKEWIRVDIQEASKKLGIDMSQFPQGGNDPTKVLDYMRAAGDVEEEGEEDVRGVPTTHYSATVDLHDYPDLVPESERADVRESVDRLIELAGESELETEVWIDKDDLVRRIRMDMPMKAPTGEQIESRIDYELYDFGTKVNVEPPPAEDVVDYTDIAAESSQLQAP